MTNLSAAANALKAQPQERSNLSPIASAVTVKSKGFEEQQAQMEKENKLRQNMSSIMAALRAERKSQGLKQNQLARLAGVSPAVVSAAECRLCVSLDCLLKIAGALGKKININ